MIWNRRLTLALLGAAPLAATASRAQTVPPPPTMDVPPPDGSPETVESSAMAKTNVAALRAYMAALNGGDIPGAVSYFAPDTRNHGKPVGRPGLTRVLTDLRTMFPDYRHDALEISAVGDVVVSRNKVSGTHLGVGKVPVEGGMLVGVAPTGRPFVVQHIHWWRFKDGLIVEHYATRDDLAMMRQLGLVKSV